jgi:hypothetical protein
MSQKSSYNESYKDLLENKLRRYANLLLLNGSFVDDPGLGKGKIGIAIFFYHYHRLNGCNQFGDYADDLIDQIYEELNINTPIDFENGLAGIGWGIEYLVENKFIEGDPDEILNEINDKIIKTINGFSPEERAIKKNESGYNIYQKVKRRRELLSESELVSFIKLQDFVKEPVTIPLLIKSENYGLFDGLAGEAFIMLRELSEITA